MNIFRTLIMAVRDFFGVTETEADICRAFDDMVERLLVAADKNDETASDHAEKASKLREQAVAADRESEVAIDKARNMRLRARKIENALC